MRRAIAAVVRPAAALLPVSVSRRRTGVAIVRSRFPSPSTTGCRSRRPSPTSAPRRSSCRMSRASPGRYSLHDFAKNVYDVHAFGADGRELPPTRPDPYGWRVDGHGGSVRRRYKVFGDRVDGTYLAIDPTHAHINMPAAIMWARGLDDRPSDAHLRAAAQGAAGASPRSCMPGPAPLEFTAPNLQYLMDSPAEFGPVAIRAVHSRRPRTFRFAAASHRHRRRARRLRQGRREDRPRGSATSSASSRRTSPAPTRSSPTTCRTPTATAWSIATARSSRRPRRFARSRGGLLDTVAHEFFHCWNVERIRPRSLEPFDFDARTCRASCGSPKASRSTTGR